MPARLHAFDLAIVALYLIAITLFGLRVARAHRTADRSLRGYFLANRSAPWWAIALSIVSAETSTLTIISIPGVAFAGDFGFLQIVLGYMLGRIVVAALFLPKLLRRRDAHRLSAHRPPLRPHPPQGHCRRSSSSPAPPLKASGSSPSPSSSGSPSARETSSPSPSSPPSPSSTPSRAAWPRSSGPTSSRWHLPRRNPRRYLVPSANTSPAAGRTSTPSPPPQASSTCSTSSSTSPPPTPSGPESSAAPSSPWPRTARTS